jgi:hypothetical protein
MNNQTPYNLYKNNKTEFLNKLCSICLCILFYPESGEKMEMVSCSKLSCNHMFHTGCINRVTNNKCPECRETGGTIINIDKSLELTIRNDAFDNNDIDNSLRVSFSNECLKLADYPYHKIVFERWHKEK